MEEDNNKNNELYYNSESGKHYIDIDLPKHWFRYFTDEGEEVIYTAALTVFLRIFSLKLVVFLS
jgi:hypothetical protein